MIAKHAVHPLCSGNNKVVITYGYKESKFLTSNDGLKPFQVGRQNPMGRLTIGWSSVKISKFGLISGEEKVEGLRTWTKFSSVMANHYAWNDHFPHIYRLWFNLVVFWKVNEPVFYHWQRYDYGDEIACAFQQLSWLPNPQTLDAKLDLLDKFLATLYFKDRDNMFVDDVRYQLYMHSTSDSSRKLPPSSKGILLHIKRSAYQAGRVWVILGQLGKRLLSLNGVRKSTLLDC